MPLAVLLPAIDLTSRLNAYPLEKVHEMSSETATVAVTIVSGNQGSHWCRL